MNNRIRELAREAAGGLLSYNAEGEFRLSEKEVEKFAELVAAAEREACALEVERARIPWTAESVTDYLAAEIRARGGKA